MKRLWRKGLKEIGQDACYKFIEKLIDKFIIGCG